jgi:hypothetical protein
VGHQVRPGFVPLLIVLAVFLLVMFVKRPWRVLGGLALAFVVAMFLGLFVSYQRQRVASTAFLRPPRPTVVIRHAEGLDYGGGNWLEAHGVPGRLEVETRTEETCDIGGSFARWVQGAARVAAAVEHAHAEHVDEHPSEDLESAAAAHEEPAREESAHEESAATVLPPARPTSSNELGDRAVAPSPLDVPPDAVVVAKRPKWTEEPDHKVGDNTYIVVVRSGLAMTPYELDKQLDLAMAEACREYLIGVIPEAENMGIPNEYLRNKVLKAQHTETVQRQFDAPAGFDDPGAMTYVRETWGRLEFDPEVKRDLEHMWEQQVAERRLWQFGGVGGLVLAVLASVLGYLRLDTATKGFYTRTLRWGAAAVILGLLAAGWLLLVG